MCGICLTAAGVSIVFLTFIGIFLAALTDKKIGLPLGILAALLAGSQLRVLMLAPRWWLPALIVVIAVRGLFVMITNKEHWVWGAKYRLESRVRHLVRPLFARIRGSKA